MSSFFDGLYSFEVVLLAAGSLFFVALLVVLFVLVFQKRSYVGLLPFFVVSLVMMGFPGIAEFKISKDLIDITTKTNQLQDQPKNEALRASLQQQVLKLSARPFNDPKNLTTIAAAQFAVGEDAQASHNVDRAVSADPRLQGAADLKQKIEVGNRVTALAAQAERQPDNPQLRQELEKTLSQASQFKFANPKALESISKGSAILKAQPPASGPVGHINPAALAVPAGNLNNH